MFLNRQWAVFQATTWCLFAVWLLFGGVELAEQAQLTVEWAGEDQEASDQDEAALTQLASGVRSTGQIDLLPCGLVHTASHEFVDCSEDGSRRPEPLVHGPPSLPLHQYISTYRI
jgi:hypothetical protein